MRKSPTRMPKVSEQHVEARRMQILQAAMQSFARNGFHQTSMQEVCRQAELSPGAVYSYFASKEEIIETLAELSLARNRELLSTLRAKGDVRQALRGLLEAIGDYLRAPAGYELSGIKVGLWAEAVRNQNIMMLFRRTYHETLSEIADIVRQGQERGEVSRSISAEAVAQLLVSMIDGLVLQLAFDPDLDLTRYATAIDALVDGSLWQGDW